MKPNYKYTQVGFIMKKHINNFNWKIILNFFYLLFIIWVVVINVVPRIPFSSLNRTFSASTLEGDVFFIEVNLRRYWNRTVGTISIDGEIYYNDARQLRNMGIVTSVNNAFYSGMFSHISFYDHFEVYSDVFVLDWITRRYFLDFHGERRLLFGPAETSYEARYIHDMIWGNVAE